MSLPGNKHQTIALGVLIEAMCRAFTYGVPLRSRGTRGRFGPDRSGGPWRRKHGGGKFKTGWHTGRLPVPSTRGQGRLRLTPARVKALNVARTRKVA